MDVEQIEKTEDKGFRRGWENFKKKEEWGEEKLDTNAPSVVEILVSARPV